jgi:hypothetical protein
MTERQFSELRRYREASGTCISDWDSATPLRSLITNSYLREIVKDCWAITDKGITAFDAVVAGTSNLRANREPA